MSVDKVELGRHLFFDDRLSGNRTMSCASCHQPTLGFGQARRTPFGSTGQTLPRNSPPLANVAWFGSLTWGDDTTLTLEQQMHGPLFATQPVEMGVTPANRDEVLARFATAAPYPELFGRAFPNVPDPLSWDNLIRAIASFQRALVSGDSRWDRAQRGELPLEAAELRGRDLFFSDRTGCASCHGGPTFAEPTTFLGVPVGTAFHNVGLYNLGGTGGYPAPNRGLFERTGLPSDMGRMRTPSLRNVEVTGPYMHDGSVPTLAEVIAVYVAGGRDLQFGPNAGDGRTNPFKSPLVRPLDLTASEQADLLAFLRALTDAPFLTDPRFSNPFAPR
jgi:cytochrome c peroxidase